MKPLAVAWLLICSTFGWSAAGDSTEVIPNLVMVPIPAGTFMMGTDSRDDDDNPNRDKLTLFYEQPAHHVALDAFLISTYEITQEQYMRVMNSTNPSEFKGNDNLPVETALWYGAAVFCNRLSKMAGFEPCYNPNTWWCDFSRTGFRLPTVADWMYAAGVGANTNFYTGETESDLARAGWYSRNSGQNTHVVGQKEPNAWGLYDMHGNVWEWCNDWFSEYYYMNSPVNNPMGPDKGIVRVVRGGGWLSDALYCRLNCRAYCRPNIRRRDIGFRVVRRP